MEVTLTSTSITFTEEGFAIRFIGTDLVRAYYKYENLPEFNTVASEWYVHLVLDGSVREAMGKPEYIFPLASNLLTNKPTWTTADKQGTGAQQAIDDITPILRASPTAGAGTVTDVTATAPLTSTGGATPDIALSALGVTAAYLAANAVTTTKILDANVTNAKLANMAQATFKGRTDGSGTGVPQDLNANQASTILDGATDPFVRTSAAGSGDVVGPASAVDSNVALFNGITGKLIKDGGTLGTAAFQPSSAFDASGAAAAAQAASQPLDSDLTAIAALATTAYGRDLLIQADAAATRTYIGAGTGSGDVVGPASAVDNAVPRYDLTTGKLIQSSPVLITDAGAIHIPNISTPTSPAAGSVGVFSRGIANRQLIAQIGPSGLTTALQPLLARNKVAIWNPAGNAVNAPGVFGVTPLTIQGSNTARNVATTNLFTRTKRIGYATSAVAGQVAGIRGTALQYTTGDGAGLGGFFWVCRFGISGNTTDSRIVVGIRVNTGAATNVEPSTLNNIVAVGKGAADTTFSVFYGGSAAQTPIALGANFPADTVDTDFYELALFSSPFQTGTVDYQFTRLNTGDVASGTLSGSSAVIPASTQPFNFCNISICNNATAAIVAIDVASIYMETDY